LTVNELNQALLAEMPRLGGRGPIDEVMKIQFNVTSISELSAEQYQALVDAVKAVAV